MCLHEYFQGNCRYASDCFRRLKYTYWATSHTNIMTPRPIQQKGPTFLGNGCLFSHFGPIFDLYKSQYQYFKTSRKGVLIVIWRFGEFSHATRTHFYSPLFSRDELLFFILYFDSPLFCFPQVDMHGGKG